MMIFCLIFVLGDLNLGFLGKMLRKFIANDGVREFLS
jgi:hypothetical protein